MIVDARGHRCPVPSLRLQAAARLAPGGTTITVLATDPMARIDVPFLVQEMGGRVLSIDQGDAHLIIVVETPVAPKG